MEPQVTDATLGSPEPPGRSPATLGWLWLWPLALIAATLAGVGAWLGGEATVNQFVPAENMVQAKGMTINAPTFQAKASAGRKNATVANGILGAALGLALGLVGGLARRSPGMALASGLMGTILGLGVGAAASEAILPFYYQRLDTASEELSHDLIFPLLIHGGIWSAVGLAGGASLGLGLGVKRRIASAALGGLIGGALGAGAYELIGALAFPTSGTSEPLATYWAPRLVGKLAVTLLATAIAVVAVGSPDVKKPTKAA